MQNPKIKNTATLQFHRPCYNVSFCPIKSTVLAVISSDHKDLRYTSSLHILKRSGTWWVEKKKLDYCASLLDIQWCDGKFILTSSGNGSLQIWDWTGPNHGPFLLQGHSDEVNSIDVCRKTYKAISASSDSSLILWDLKEKKSITQYQTEAVCFQAKFRPKTNDIFASVSSDRSLKIWDVRSSPKPVHCVPEAHQVNCYSCSWCPGFRIATSGADTFINVWDVRILHTPLFILGPIQTPTKKVSFAPASNHIVGTISCDGMTRLWDLCNSYNLVEIKHHSGFASGLDWNSMNCNLNKKEIADCGWDGSVKIYDYFPFAV